MPPQRRGIGFVFQHYAAFKHMTVKDNVAFGLSVRKKPKAEIEDRVGELLKIVGLAGYARPLPEPALRRAATADGARARAGGRAARAPARRAVRSAGREGACRAARVAQEAARGRSRDHAARDPRPGGGDVDRLPDRGHGQRPNRADRQPGRALRQAGQPLRHGLPRRDHEGRRRPRAPPRHHDQARAGRGFPRGSGHAHHAARLRGAGGADARRREHDLGAAHACGGRRPRAGHRRRGLAQHRG